MKRSVIYVSLLLGLLWEVSTACEPVLHGQTQSIHDPLSASLPLLIKDSVLLEYLSIDQDGIRFYAKKEKQTEWHIFPEEYPIARELLRHTPSEELVDVFNEKGTRKWKEQEIKIEPKMPKVFPVLVSNRSLDS